MMQDDSAPQNPYQVHKAKETAQEKLAMGFALEIAAHLCSRRNRGILPRAQPSAPSPRAEILRFGRLSIIWQSMVD